MKVLSTTGLTKLIQLIKNTFADKSSLSTVATSGSYNDLTNKPTIDSALSTTSENAVQNKVVNTALGNKVDKVSTANKIYGTDASGNQTTYNKSDLGSVLDVKVNNTSVVTSGVANITLGSMASEATTSYYTKTEVDGLVGAVYKPAGSIAYASLPTPSSTNLGYVYNVTDGFTTDSRFVEGSGKSYPSGTNVVIINTSGETYKFDVLSGFVDLSDYVPTSRKVNNKPLSSDISLTASDVGAQPTLVSGTNIKTVNNTSLLGSGNITIDSLPSQSGNNGKVLTTNGSSASWETVPLPSIATTSTAGIVKPDGTTITITNDGTISSNGSTVTFRTWSN